MNGFEWEVEESVKKPERWVMEEITYRVVNGLPEILIFGRNYEDKFRTAVHTVRGFRPFFYIPAKEREYHHLIEGYSPDTEIDALGREVRKCYTRIPADVPNVRDLMRGDGTRVFSFTDMSDFLFEKRYLVDTGIKYAYTWDAEACIATPCEVPAILVPRVVYYDIEVLDKEDHMPLPNYPMFPIVSIQVKDSYTKNRIVFTYKVPQTSDPEHIACKTEQELFRAFSSYLEEIDPDVVTGWNTGAYDVPYLVKRGLEIGATVKHFGRIGKPFAVYEEEINRWNIRIKGRSTLDMLVAFKKLMIMKSQRESYALKEVSKDYGMPYADYGPKLMRLFTSKDWATFLQYCKNDVDALDLIDHHDDIKLFEFYETVRMICGTRLDDTQFNSKLIEMKLLHDGIKPMPAKVRINASVKRDKFEGALVLLPQPGIHDNVGTVDLAALYPTIMMAFPDETSPDIDHKIIDMLKTFVAEREKLRSKRSAGDNSSGTALQEYAYKVLANSVYGVVGSPTFRLFKRECAEFVTRTGREVSLYLHSKLRAYSYSVLYSDTDSAFFSQIKTPEEGLRIQDQLNADLKVWGDERGAKVVFTLKFEKLYKRLMFKLDSSGKGAAKKKYCGHLIWKEGVIKDELNFKGLELARSDQSQFSKECLNRFLTMALIESNEGGAVEYVRTIYRKSLTGELDYRTVSIPRAIRSIHTDSPHARGIKNTKNELGYIIPDGVKPRLLLLTSAPHEICIDDEIELPPSIISIIDWHEMTHKTITMKMKSYIESIGYSWDTIIHGQSSLFFE